MNGNAKRASSAQRKTLIFLEQVFKSDGKILSIDFSARLLIFNSQT